MKSFIIVTLVSLVCTSVSAQNCTTSTLPSIPFNRPVIILGGCYNPPPRVIRETPRPIISAAAREAGAGVATGTNSAYREYVEPVIVQNPFTVKVGNRYIAIQPPTGK